MTITEDSLDEELCLICEKPFEEGDITVPRRPDVVNEKVRKSHLECIENLIPKRYPKKTKE